MQYQPNFIDGIEYAQNWLRRNGQHVTTESWQGIKKPRDMFEAYDFAMKVPLNVKSDITIHQLQEQIKPNLPWADKHFEERISGIPYNPPPSNEIWPFATKMNDEHKQAGIFSHTYPERYWPKTVQDDFRGKPMTQKEQLEYRIKLPGDNNWGLRYKLGDLNDVIALLFKEPHTRQAYLPIWFPEDTGAVEGQRVPCTLGYLFRLINGHLHITYKIRSCDFYRHFRDDIYMTCRLLISVLDQLKYKFPDGSGPLGGYDWTKVKLGYFKMQIDSLHTFGLESQKL